MNHTPQTLPPLSPELTEHSDQLKAKIAVEIKSAGGVIPFSRFFELAMYTPNLGYYSAGLHKFGEAGDFVTAPEISPLFSRTLAQQLEPVLAQCNQPKILEFGAGSGTMAAEILRELEKQDQLPAQYLILELSGTLRTVQQEKLEKEVPHLLDRVVWLDQLPEEKFQGAVLANEVLDAIPFERFVWRNQQAMQIGVALDKSSESSKFVWQETGKPLNAQLSDDLQKTLQQLPDGYLSEIRPAVSPWIGSVADALEQGIALLMDYGYDRHDYYRPERDGGTLKCFFRHHTHDDPLQYIGLQDVTAHVDFTAVAEAADAAGLEVAGYTSQMWFLLSGGITELAAEEPQDELQQQLMNSQAIQKLTMPAQMGEIIKVMALTRNIELPMSFTMQDLRHFL